MTKLEQALEQAYVTHCTFHTSFYHQESLDRGGDRTYEYTTRAGSFDRAQGLGFYQKFRSVAYYRNYRPQGASDDELRERTCKDFPVRFAFLPDTGGHDLLVHACYRGSDTSKSRRAQSFFVHMLYQHRGTAKTPSLLTARNVLPLWGSTAWVNEDSDNLQVQLPTCELLSDFAKPAVDHFERTLHSFVTVQLPDEILDPCELIPDRWKQASLEARQNLIRAILRGYLGIATQSRVSLVVVAEPEFAAFLFYTVARLLPQRGFAANLSFSTFELTTDTFFPCKLVGTTSESPETTQFTNRTGGPILNTFAAVGFSSEAELIGKETAFERSIFKNITQCPYDWLSLLDEDLKHIENAAPQSAADLDPALDSARIVKTLLHPREDMDVALPVSKDQRAYITRTVAPHISELFQGTSLTIITQQPELFWAYINILEDTRLPLKTEAARELGQVIGDEEALKLCKATQLHIDTRLDLLTSFLEHRKNCYLGLTAEFPLDQPLPAGSQPVLQELFERMFRPKLKRLMKSLFIAKRTVHTMALLTTTLASSKRTKPEKEEATRYLLRLWATDGEKPGSDPSDIVKASRISDLLLFCVRQISREEKVAVICGTERKEVPPGESANAMKTVFNLVASAAGQDPELKADVVRAITHTFQLPYRTESNQSGNPRNISYPTFDDFWDRLTVICAMSGCLEAKAEIFRRAQDYRKLASQLKARIESLLLHIHAKPTMNITFFHSKHTAALRAKVIWQAVEIVYGCWPQSFDPSGGGHYKVGGNYAGAVLALANFFGASMEPGEVHSELTRRKYSAQDKLKKAREKRKEALRLTLKTGYVFAVMGLVMFWISAVTFAVRWAQSGLNIEVQFEKDWELVKKEIGFGDVPPVQRDAEKKR